MRSVVTGGAGFIGSHLVDRLIAAGEDVIVLDDLSTGSEQNLHHHAGNARLKFVRGSILDVDAVNDAVGNADRVFHLAAAVGVAHIVRDPLGGMLTNVRGTENVLAACAQHHRKVLLASTSEVYGKSPRIPMAEDDDRLLGPTSVPRWSYSTAKALDEHLGLAYAAVGAPVVIVRYFNSYGPRLDERGYGSVIANFLRQAHAGGPLIVYGDGNQTRCFTFVDDTVSGTLAAMDADTNRGRIFNIGNPATEISIADLATRVLEASGQTAEIVRVPFADVFGPNFEDTPRRVPSIDRAISVLNWRPTTDLAPGLSATARWWADNLVAR